MGKPEFDPVTGEYTTGHEWDGIKELSTPIPNWWIRVFLASVAVAAVYLWLYPAFTLGDIQAKGYLGWSSEKRLEAQIEAGKQSQAGWMGRLEQTPLDAVEQDPELRHFAVSGGRALFRENCAQCHGAGAGGQQGQFPSLIDDDWLWGGTLADIHQTIKHGIRAQDDEGRLSEMPAYGEIFSQNEIAHIADYVLALSQPATAAQRPSMPGARAYLAECAACHGAEGEGNTMLGAPRLNDAIWLYGSSREAIIQQITRPQMGMMPAFAGRLDDQQIKMLAVYVHNLGGGVK